MYKSYKNAYTSHPKLPLLSSAAASTTESYVLNNNMQTTLLKTQVHNKINRINTVKNSHHVNKLKKYLNKINVLNKFLLKVSYINNYKSKNNLIKAKSTHFFKTKKIFENFNNYNYCQSHTTFTPKYTSILRVIYLFLYFKMGNNAYNEVLPYSYKVISTNLKLINLYPLPHLNKTSLQFKRLLPFISFLKNCQHSLKLSTSTVFINTGKDNYNALNTQVVTKNKFLEKDKYFLNEIIKKIFINKLFLLNKESVFITPLKNYTYYNKYNSKLTTT